MGQVFLTAANAVLPIVLLILLGYSLKQSGFFSEGFLSVGNRLVFKVCLPITLFMSVYSIESLQNVGWDVVIYCVVITFVIFALGIVTALRATKSMYALILLGGSSISFSARSMIRIKTS